jgi:ATP adenylyltransferase
VDAPALAFYNGGEIAGASQPHKHLQIVPLPLAASGPPVPMAALLPAGGHGEMRSVPQLPFRHAFARLNPAAFEATAKSTLLLHGLYRRLLAEAGIPVLRIDGQERQGAPYNLLVTREWVLVVPRSRERFETVSVNALGFAGSFFLRNREELRAVEQYGPMAVLRSVAIDY